jgi:hypothetical protein
MVTVWSAITSHLLFSQPPHTVALSTALSTSSVKRTRTTRQEIRQKPSLLQACPHQGKEFVIRCPVYTINFRIFMIVVKHSFGLFSVQTLIFPSIFSASSFFLSFFLLSAYNLLSLCWWAAILT